MDVAVVLVNFDSGVAGVAAARSVRRQTGCRVQLVVVDNASTDASLAAIIAAADPDVVIRNDVNLGYAAAVNQGIVASSGGASCAPVVVPMNCDAVLGDGYLAGALAVLTAQVDVAVVGGTVEQPGGVRRGAQELTFTMRVSDVPSHPGGRVLRTDASCPVWRRAAIDQVTAVFSGAGVGRSGPLDERFFVYGENVDLACKLWRLGWSAWFEPTLHATHARSFSSADRLADKRGPLRRMVLLSRYVNVIRHVPARVRPLSLLACVVEDLGFAALQACRGDVAAVRDVVATWRSMRASWSAERSIAARAAEVSVRAVPVRFGLPRRAGRHRSS